MKAENGRERILFVGVAASLLAAVLPVPAWAKDFTQRTAAEKRSAEKGLDRAEVTLLRREPGPGRKDVADKLMARFAKSTDPMATAGSSKRQEKRNRLDVVADRWILTVKADGTQARYRNHAYVESKPDLGKDVSQRFSNEKLEAMGRKFIEANLADLIKLGEKEELVPYFTEFMIAGGGGTAPNDKPQEEKVLASTVVFTRAVDKVNVVGPGSKVAITFANDEKPVAFHYDWPSYKSAGRSQKVAPLDEIKNRRRKVAKLDPDARDVELKRFDCGYYDAGALRRDTKAVIQAGCAMQAVKNQVADEKAHSADPRSGQVTVAAVDVIPAGEKIEPDSGWPQAVKMLGGREAKGKEAPKNPPATQPKTENAPLLKND